MVIEAGTVTPVPLVDMVTAIPVAGAAELSTAVQSADPPAVILAGAQVKPESCGVAVALPITIEADLVMPFAEALTTDVCAGVEEVVDTAN